MSEETKEPKKLLIDTEIDNKISENYDYDDETYVWNIFGHKPSKFSIHATFDFDSFWSYYQNIDESNKLVSSTVMISDDSAFYTNKYLIALDENIFISFYESIESDLNTGDDIERYISKCSYYYNNKEVTNKYVNDVYVDDISSCILPQEESVSNLNYLVYVDNRLELESVNNTIPYEKDDSKFLNEYESETKYKISDLIKSLEDDKNSIYYLYGTRLTDKKEMFKDKQSAIGHIIDKSNKTFIIIPSNIFEVFITSLGLTELFRSNPNSIFIVDGAENLIYDEKILNGLGEIVKGVMSNFIPCKFVFSFNSTSESDIPEYLKSHAEMFIKFGGSSSNNSSYL